ncbi:MAG: radical SAM protein [Candidatus Riflebacteria bacterium]|nr:radical SAM protein [Candidatus Riflebacteria bacterium]
MTLMSIAGDRHYDVTRSTCPACRKLVCARIVGRDGRVLMVTACPDHGESEALISSSEDYYLESLSCLSRGSRPREFARTVSGGCPDDCGFCPDHEQHVCMPVIEITDSCDLACPICLVENVGQHEMSLATLKEIVARLLDSEESIQVLNLSGGEPTMHSGYHKLLEYLAGIDRIFRVSVSTNGVRLAREPGLRALHKELDVVVSLQLDGFSPDTYERLRGPLELARTKQQLLQQIVEEELPASLTMTLVRGVNEAELGQVLDVYLAHDNLLSLTIQPFTHAGHGRGFPHDPLTRITIPDVIELLRTASRGVLRPSDFGPLPCCHPACFCQTFLLKVEGGGWLPLKRLLRQGDYMGLLENRSYMSPDGENLERIRGMVYDLWAAPAEEPGSADGATRGSGSAVQPAATLASAASADRSQRDGALRTIKRIFKEIDASGIPGPKRTVRIVERRKKSIFIHQFMDVHTFDLSRVRRCCSVYPKEDGALYPMCVYNVLRRCR